MLQNYESFITKRLNLCYKCIKFFTRANITAVKNSTYTKNKNETPLPALIELAIWSCTEIHNYLS